MPACQECVQKSHSGPECVVKQLPEAIRGKKEFLGQYTAECSKKLLECTELTSNLNMAFEELEMQKDNTKGLIEETFQSYKAVLEETRVSIYLICKEKKKFYIEHFIFLTSYLEILDMFFQNTFLPRISTEIFPSFFFAAYRCNLKLIFFFQSDPRIRHFFHLCSH